MTTTRPRNPCVPTSGLTSPSDQVASHVSASPVCLSAEIPPIPSAVIALITRVLMRVLRSARQLKATMSPGQNTSSVSPQSAAFISHISCGEHRLCLRAGEHCNVTLFVGSFVSVQVSNDNLNTKQVIAKYECMIN